MSNQRKIGMLREGGREREEGLGAGDEHCVGE